MRAIRNLTIFLLVGMAIFYFLSKEDIVSEEAVQHVNQFIKEKKIEIKEKSVPENRLISDKFTGDLYQWIDKPANMLLDAYGEPERKDDSAYGYKWWIYKGKKDQYVQFGIADQEIKTIFAIGNDIDSEPVNIGDSYEQVNKQLGFNDEVNFNRGISSYSFHLNDEDMKMRPLAKISNSIFIQCYFDTFTDKLSSIRILSADILLKQRPYELHYRGDLPEVPDLSEKEWEKVEKGMEQQIFDITNVLRTKHKKSRLRWEDAVSDVAFLHSKDMAKHNYFSHYSQNGDGLKERLAAKKIYYFSAGENIAAQYPDAPAAIEGWLNSEGHREALLNNDYTHLGVGVYRLYYTQNFIAKPL